MTNLYRALEQARGGPGPARGVRPARFEAEMRALRSQLQPLFEARKPTLLTITACNHQEGSTTVARELCRSLALDGIKVLLCGRPDLAGAPRPRPRPGAIERKTLKTVIPTLWFVDISDLQQEDARNTAPVEFRDWLEKVKAQFDVIVCDAPPILNQPSWGPLFRNQDGVLLILEAEQTRSMVLTTTISAIEVAGGHILGLIFNKRRQYIPEPFYRWL
jgi:Mrp family chromosome partitioning ATPase